MGRDLVVIVVGGGGVWSSIRRDWTLEARKGILFILIGSMLGVVVRGCEVEFGGCILWVD